MSFTLFFTISYMYGIINVLCEYFNFLMYETAALCLSHF